MKDFEFDCIFTMSNFLWNLPNEYIENFLTPTLIISVFGDYDIHLREVTRKRLEDIFSDVTVLNQEWRTHYVIQLSKIDREKAINILKEVLEPEPLWKNIIEPEWNLKLDLKKWGQILKELENKIEDQKSYDSLDEMID